MFNNGQFTSETRVCIRMHVENVLQQCQCTHTCLW